MAAVASADISLFEDFRLDRLGGVLFRRDQQGVFVPVAIGSRAFDILGLLVAHPGDLVSRDEIMKAAWPGTVVEDGNINVQVAALRHILDRDREQGSCIQTVSGRGYRFAIPIAKWEDGVPTASHGGRPAPRLSIVVLPFTNLSTDPDQQYFADGITEDLTTDLSRITDSFVISRNTAFTYRGKSVDTRQIGRELGVRYLLEGSVRRAGNQIRVNAQVIDTENDAHLWGERFDRDSRDLFALQDEITSRIAVALNRELVAAEAARPTEHPDALDYIFMGRAAANKPPTRDSQAESISWFVRALALDEHSVVAQSLLVSALSARVMSGMADSAASDIARAERLAGQVMATSPLSRLAHNAKGQVLRAQRRFAEAIPEYERVLALDRNSVTTLHSLAQCKLFAGSIEETIPLEEQAIRLSPRDPQIGIWYQQIGIVHLLQSRTDEAIVWFERARTANPTFPGFRACLAAAHALKGDSKQAIVELAEARRLSVDRRYSSLARLGSEYYGVPKIRALYEATYFAGLRKAGMPQSDGWAS